MRSLGLLLLLLLGTGGHASSVAAQGSHDGRTIVRAAVTDLLRQLQVNDSVPDGPFLYDSRFLELVEHVRPDRPPSAYYAQGSTRNEHDVAPLQAAGAIEGEMEAARYCPPESPRGCRLRDGLVAAFATSHPEVRNDTAYVVVKSVWLSNLVKQPLQEGVFRMMLTRQPGGWRIVRTETLWIS